MAWIDAEIYHLFFADNHLLQALVLFVGLDYIAGVCVAIQKKKLSSQIGIQYVAESDDYKNGHLPCDSFGTDLAGQFLFLDRDTNHGDFVLFVQ